MAAIRAALDAQDSEKLHLSSHTLKGAMRYFGETPAYQEVFAIETLAREGNIAGADKSFGRLDLAVKELLRGIEDYLQKKVVESARDPAAPR